VQACEPALDAAAFAGSCSKPGSEDEGGLAMAAVSQRPPAVATARGAALLKEG
jgi:hypothetical protein